MAKVTARAANTIKPSLAIPMHYDASIGLWKDVEEFKRLEMPFEMLEKSK